MVYVKVSGIQKSKSIGGHTLETSEGRGGPQQKLAAVREQPLCSETPGQRRNFSNDSRWLPWPPRYCPGFEMSVPCFLAPLGIAAMRGIGHEEPPPDIAQAKPGTRLSQHMPACIAVSAELITYWRCLLLSSLRQSPHTAAI